MFETIEDRQQIAELIGLLQKCGQELSEARRIAKDIITRKLPRPEWVRTIYRQKYPQWNQMILEIRELVAQVKEEAGNG